MRLASRGRASGALRPSGQERDDRRFLLRAGPGRHELPSLDELRAKLIGLLNAPATKIARTVKEPGAQLARVIQAKASQGDAA